MKRTLLIGATLLASASTFAAERIALLVAVDEYPALKGQPQLAGAAEDLNLAQSLLKGYQFGSVGTLLGPQATKAAVLKGLNDLAAKASAGDHVVFYFSGRGGKARVGQDTLIATLSPYDATKASGSSDVPVTALEEFSKKVRLAGATPVIILDACWSAVRSRVVEARPYNPVQRYFDRGAVDPVRPTIVDADAIVLAASGATGSTYEWKTGENRYAGAFTNLLVNAAATAAIRGAEPSGQELLAGIKRDFVELSRQGYMPGFSPEASGPAGSSLFGVPLQLSSEGDLGKLVSDLREQAKQFRISIDIDETIEDPEQRGKLFAAVYQPLRRYARTKMDGVLVLEPSGARPDRVLLVSGTPGALEVRVLDDEQRRTTREAPSVTGASIEEVLDSELGERIQRDAYITRLYRAMDVQKDSLNGEFTLDMATAYRLDVDEFKATISSSQPVRAYFFDRSDENGSVSLLFPRARAHATTIAPKKPLTLPSAGKMIFRKGSPLGRTETRVLLIAEGAGIPPLKGPDAVDFRKSLVAQLREVLKKIDSGELKWASRRVFYEVKAN